MGPLPHLLVPDSPAKALIAQQRSSSSPTSSIDSPIEHCVPVASPSLPSPHTCSPQGDLSLPSSSSSLSNLVPEIQPWRQSKVSLRRRKTKQEHAQKKDERSDDRCQERSAQKKPRRDSADRQKKRKGCQDNVCCKCAAAFTADCAAVCCCPLALLHLAALTLIRLPTALAWKMVVSLKNKIYPTRRSAKTSEEDSPRPHPSPWSNGSSLEEGRGDRGVNTVRVFDRENLWQGFEGRGLDFGALSMSREHL